MKSIIQAATIIAISFVVLAGSGCEQPRPHNANSTPGQPASPTPATGSNSNSTPTPSGAETPRSAGAEWAVTLPVLDAFFEDPSFSSELKSKLNLTEAESGKLRTIAKEATAELRKTARENSEGDVPTSDLRLKAENAIKSAIGEERTRQLFALVAERWSAAGANATPASAAPSAIPSDTRIVVNIPAFRMDVFENGTLLKSYTIGIGYPEFPLPTGLRAAETIIFNPTWTPPDEPWVEAPGSKVEVGKTVKAGDRLNPLGILKIPIGLPSLIHGGKSIARIGTFASHGCVGLTDAQAKDLAKLLARLRSVELTDQQIAQYAKNRTETKTIKLASPVPVELRYETIVVVDGILQIYRDVYDRDTNTDQHLRSVLQSNGITFEQLSEAERARVMTGLAQMSRDAKGRLAANPDAANANSATESTSKDRVKPNNGNARTPITRNIKGQKAVVVELALLKGKGYPAPLDLDAGSGPKAASSTKNRGSKAKAPGSK